jgi:hypothetical protein
MKLLLESDLEPLLEERQGPCVSLYLPISGVGSPQGTIRLKNLLRQASVELRARGLDQPDIDSLLEPLEDLVDDFSIWNTREQGMALFRAPGFTSSLHLQHALPERCVIGDHFFLKPLFPYVVSDQPFYVLALSQNETRLLEATCRTVRRLELDGLPGSLTEALGAQKTPQDLQYHTASRARAAALPAIYHGQGVGEGDVKDELHRYLARVAAAMRKLLAGRTTPLVLAGAAPLPSIYREISAYPGLTDPVIPGNPEHLSDSELRDRAWRLLEPQLGEIRRRAADRFGELAMSGRVSSRVAEILPAAQDGRVETLFLACDADVWGHLDDRLRTVQVHAKPEMGDEDLLDSAALFSLRNGGAVYGMAQGEVPGGGEMAAIFRY